MAIVKDERKTFPLWFQDDTKNANYGSEYMSCLKNLPIGNQTETSSTISGVVAGLLKFVCSVLAPDGKTIYYIPRDATVVMKLNTETNAITSFGSFLGSYKYGSAVLAPNGKIYCIPASASQILVIDTSDDSTYLIPTVIAGASNKYQGCSLNLEGTKIFCPPYNNADTLVIDIATETVSYITGKPVGNLYWSAQLAPNGKIYCPPNEGGVLMIIDTSGGGSYTQVSGIDINTNAYFSSCLAPNGFIYALNFACPDGILKINTATDTISFIARVASTTVHAKLAPNGKIYGLGTEGNLISFDPVTETYTTIATAITDMWGMQLANNGKLYSTPRNANVILSVLSEQATNTNLPLSRFNNKV